MDEHKKIFEILSGMKKQLDRIEQKIEKKTVLVSESPKPKNRDTIVEKIIDKIDPIKLEYLNDLASVSDQCVYLLNFISLVTNGKGGLTTDEMKQALAEKFGLTTITINNISMSMKNATGKHVTRIKISDKTEKYQYQILAKGKKYIENKIKNLIKKHES